MPITRFAPSPTGYLHLGHAYAAIFARDAAQGGNFLLRIEDIDPTRCKPEFAAAIEEDLGWLGLTWPQPVRRQSDHTADYAAALGLLRQRHLLYPCFCTRGDIMRDAQRAASAPHQDDDILIYPGTCRSLSLSERADRLAEGMAATWRLDVAEAMRQVGVLTWHDRSQGVVTAMPQMFGDVVLARKDIQNSYHLSVTVDDHLQNVGLVTRGEDLFASTHIHRLLQALLGYATPDYHHHPVITDPQGRRYAKRDQSVTLRAWHESGLSAWDVIEKLPRSAYSK